MDDTLPNDRTVYVGRELNIIADEIESDLGEALAEESGTSLVGCLVRPSLQRLGWRGACQLVGWLWWASARVPLLVDLLLSGHLRRFVSLILESTPRDGHAAEYHSRTHRKTSTSLCFTLRFTVVFSSTPVRSKSNRRRLSSHLSVGWS